MPSQEHLEPPSEEIQFSRELKNATKLYGEIEDEIKKVGTAKELQPTYRLPGAPNIKDESKNVRIFSLRQQQNIIKESISEKANELAKNNPHEVGQRILDENKKWQESNIYERYLQDKENPLETPQERMIDIVSEFEQEQLQKINQQKDVEQDNFPKDSWIDSYDVTVKLGGSKFMEKVPETVEKEKIEKTEFQEKDIEQKDTGHKDLSNNSWIDSYDPTNNLLFSDFMENKDDNLGKGHISDPSKKDKQPLEPEPHIPGEDD